MRSFLWISQETFLDCAFYSWVLSNLWKWEHFTSEPFGRVLIGEHECYGVTIDFMNIQYWSYLSIELSEEAFVAKRALVPGNTIMDFHVLVEVSLLCEAHFTFLAFKRAVARMNTQMIIEIMILLEVFFGVFRLWCTCWVIAFQDLDSTLGVRVDETVFFEDAEIFLLCIFAHQNTLFCNRDIKISRIRSGENFTENNALVN